MKMMIYAMAATLISTQAFASGSITLVCKDLSERTINKKKGTVAKSGLSFTVDLGGTDSASTEEQGIVGPVKVLVETGFDGGITLGMVDAAPSVSKKTGKKIPSFIGTYKSPVADDNGDLKKGVPTEVDIDLVTPLGSKLVIKATDKGAEKAPVAGTFSFKLSKEEIKSLNDASKNDDGDPLTQIANRENAPVECDTDIN